MRETEKINHDSANIDQKRVSEILEVINTNDKKVAYAVEQALPSIAKAVNIIVRAFNNGGRLFYIGAGTSGRIAVADAAECEPTFGVPNNMVTAIMCGGKGAVFRPREGKEDLVGMGGRDLSRNGFTRKDVVVGISSSGRTPYVCGALAKAHSIGGETVALLSNDDGPVCKFANIAIKVLTGPEVLAGSTRMKAGTAQKMVLNMLSTTSMIKLGKVTGNMMTNMQITCEKLVERAIYIIVNATGVDERMASELLKQYDNNVDAALNHAKSLKEKELRIDE